MFKKRLKGLLAMVLAGSIAMTALPLSASATISGNITIKEGEEQNPSEIGVSGPLNNAYSGYLNAKNLWGIYGEETGDGSDYLIKTATGDKLAEELTGLNRSTTGYENVKIRYTHKLLVTTKDPNSEDLEVSSAIDVSEFPYEVNLNTYSFTPTTNQLQEATWTVWYGEAGEYYIIRGDATKSDSNPIPADSEKIEIPMDTFKKLYEPKADGSYYDFDKGVTIIQLKNSYKTLNLPVLNRLGEPEMIDGENRYTISVTGDCFDNLETYDKFFYVGYTKQSGDVVLSDYCVNTKQAAWTEIEEFAKNDPNFNVNTLFFLRYVDVQVNKDFTEIGSFSSRDLLLAKKDPEYKSPAYQYIEAADDNSIWRIQTSLDNFVLGKDLLKGIETYLENPSINSIVLRETTEIFVTGTDPAQIESTESYEISPLYVKNTEADPVQTVPATISDHAAVLEKAGALEAGNIFDTSNWQLWGCGFTSGNVGGPIEGFKKSSLESTNGVNSIGIDQLKTLTTNCYPLLYIPQVKDTPSNPGGNSGGSSSRPEPSYDPNKPTIDGEEKDWDDVAREIGKFSEGETKTIYLGRDKTTPADVIKAIKDSKAVITFKINSAFSWTVDGSTLTDGDIHDYDFSIEVITATGVEILRGDVGVGFKIGDISDGATLNINFKKEHAQKFANLYKKVDGELVFVDNVKIDENGAAIGLEVTEAGEYVVMLGKMSDRPGDMDNDGIMNAKDSLAILKDFLGMESGANPLVSDMNGDSFINAKDALIIVKKSVGIE